MLVDELIEQIKNNPAEWRQGEYTFIHLPTSTELWTSNGRGFLKLYRPYKADFSRRDRRRLWAVIQTCHQELTLTDLGFNAVVAQEDNGDTE